MGELEKARLAAAGAGVDTALGLHTAMERRTPSVAIVSSITRSNVGAFDLATLNKLCYAAQHGYAFVFDWGAVPADGDLNPWWRKVDVIAAYLPYFDWVVWMDGDTMFTNTSVALDVFLAQDAVYEPWRRGPVDIVITDHNENINDGVVAFRRSPWMVDFVRDWRAAGVGVHRRGSRFSWDDQGGLWHMFARLANESRTAKATGHYHDECAEPSICADMGNLLNCFNDSMYLLGHPYRERRIEHVRIVDPAFHPVPYHPESGWVRGAFDQYRREDLPDWVIFKWAPENFHVPGDMVLHMGMNKGWASMLPTCPGV